MAIRVHKKGKKYLVHEYKYIEIYSDYLRNLIKEFEEYVRIDPDATIARDGYDCPEHVITYSRAATPDEIERYEARITKIAEQREKKRKQDQQKKEEQEEKRDEEAVERLRQRHPHILREEALMEEI